MGGVGFGPPQRSHAGRTGPVSMEMLQSWLSKLGAGCQVDMNGSAQTISNGTTTTVEWARATMDTHGFWTATAPTVLTVPRGLEGVYMASGAVRWEGNSSGYRTQTLGVVINSGVMAQTSKPTLFAPTTTTTRIYPFVGRRLYLSAGDQVTAAVYQSSGGDLDLESNDDGFLQITRVGDLPREARVL